MAKSILFIVTILEVAFFYRTSGFAVFQSPSVPALIALKNELLKRNPGILNSWNESGNPCDGTWETIVTCNDSTNEVTVLSLAFPSLELVGPFPGAQLAAIDTLVKLDAGYNYFTGPIPPDLSNLTNLLELYLNNNKLSGPIPAELARLKKLQLLSLESNALSGPIPPELGSLRNLQNLDVSSNNLTGGIPSSFRNLTNLIFIDLASNSLSGPIPSFLAELSNLTDLFLNQNFFSGPIPANISQLSKLEILSLGQNELSGGIPSSLGHLPRLKTLYISSNKLSGFIPPSLGNLTSLNYLDMAYNTGINGTIPESFASLQWLTSLSASGCSLAGPIPPFLAQMGHLLELWLSDNYLQGGLPSSLGQLSSLNHLMLAGNELNGSIPDSLCDLDDVAQIDLSSNFLSGPIPSCLTTLPRLDTLNVADNRLTGPLPAILEGSNLFFLYDGNCLEGAQNQSLNCFVQLASPPPVPHNKSHSALPTLITIAVILGVLAMLCTAIVILFAVVDRGHGSDSSGLSHLNVKEYPLYRIKKATKNFTTPLGRGSFGTSYLAENLIYAGRETRALVKKSKDPSKWTELLFKCRVERYAQARHRCLVNIMGYCRHPQEHILIFEYMPYGTLHSRLHGPDQEVLAWGGRVRVALSVALALEHLHHTVSPPIIHRHVTSSNVFLTMDEYAKLAEFGLTVRETTQESFRKIASGRRSRKSRENVQSVQGEEPSEKLDVFNYGVILLELTSGQPVLKDVHITNLSAPFLEDPQMVTLMVDPRLKGYVNKNELSLICSIAKDCIVEQPQQRPSMAEIVRRLEQNLDPVYFENLPEEPKEPVDDGACAGADWEVLTRRWKYLIGGNWREAVAPSHGGGFLSQNGNAVGTVSLRKDVDDADMEMSSLISEGSSRTGA